MLQPRLRFVTLKLTQIVWIKKSEADNSRYTTDLSQCEKVEVCNPETGEIISVAKNDQDKYAPVDSDKCKVEVCDLESNTVIMVPKADANKEGYTTDLSQCEKVEVCNPETGEIISVAKNDQDKYAPVDSDKCKVEVCDLESNTVIMVPKADANKEGYTTDLSQCEKVEVCNPETGEIISVAKNDASNYEDVDSASCKPVTPPKPPVKPPVVTELPKTGLADTLGSVLGIGSLTAATYYYFASRRN